jgi:porphobilinogen synthase
VDETAKKPVPIASMPGVSRFPLKEVVGEVGRVLEQDVKAVMLFGIPEAKDETGSGAYANGGIVQQAIRKLKTEFGEDLVVIGDVCLCEYTNHGHCGIIKDGQVQNDTTWRCFRKLLLVKLRQGLTWLRRLP